MNKIKLIIIVIAMFILITGCDANEKSLKCNKTIDDSSGFKIEEKYSYKFMGNNIKEFEVVIVSTPTKDELKDFLSAFSTTINDSFKELKDKSGINYISQIKNDSHKLNIKVDYNQIRLKEFDGVSDGISDIVNKDQKKISLSETKKEMEKEDYTCIIK